MTTKPFISWIGHGAASLAQPDVFSSTTATLFVTDANITAVQALADALLNPAGAGSVRYEAFLPISMFTFLDVQRATSVPDSIGWVPGREAAIWVPLLERRPKTPFSSRIVFWSPYIFINYAIGMLTGREVWGWPKVGARIRVGGDTPSSPEFSCATMIFSTLNPGTKGEEGLLYRVVQQSAGTAQQPIWQTAAEAAGGLLGMAFSNFAGDLLDKLKLQPSVPCINLKQFRSSGNSQNACYQAIVESPIALTSFSGGGVLSNRYILEITTCESHRIVSDLLGRTADPGTTRLPVRAAAWLFGEFRALPGKDIVVQT